MAVPPIPAPVTALVRGRRASRPAAAPRHRSGAAAVLLAAVLWGTAGPAASLDVVSPPAAHAGAVRSLLAAAVLVAAVVMMGQTRALRRLLGPDRWRWLLCAAGAVAAFQVTFFAGVQQLGVALGTVVALGSAPVVGGLARAARTGTPPSGRWMLATTLAIGGIGVLLLPGADAVADPAGIALAVAAGSAFAGYTMASSRASQRGDPPLATTAAAFVASAVVLAPLLAGDDAGWLASPAGVGAALWLGVATAAVPYGLYAMGLRRVASHRALTLSLADPLTAALLGVVVLGESLGWLGGIGLLLVTVGLLLAVWPAPAPRPHTRALAAIPAHAETAPRPGHGRAGPRVAPISATLQASAASGTAGPGVHDERTDHALAPHPDAGRGADRGAHR